MPQAPADSLTDKDAKPAPSGLRAPSENETERAAQRRKKAPTAKRIARRRGRVLVVKWSLPVVALALLTAVAAWPELSRDGAAGRLTFRRGMVEPESGQLTKARYNGVDDQGRPYTVTADFARQVTQDRIDLTAPIGDLTMESGSWLRGEGKQGVYMQQAGLLDLSGDVTLYRDDGITLQTDTATLDVKAGAATSAAMVHIEGPFGTLDAQGFTLLDRGTLIQFTGPGRLVLNGQKNGDKK